MTFSVIKGHRKTRNAITNTQQSKAARFPKLSDTTLYLNGIGQRHF